MSDTDPDRKMPPRKEPVIGTKGPRASAPRGTTGGGLNDLSSATHSPGNVPRNSNTMLNPKTSKMVSPRIKEAEDAAAFKKGGLVGPFGKTKPVPPLTKLPGAARRMGAQFGQGKGKSAIKPAGKPSNPPVTGKPTKGSFGRGSGPVKQSSSSPVRKKFI